VLAAVAPAPGGDFAALAEAVALGASRLSGAIVVLLAWDAPRRALVASLRARGTPLRVWVVSEREEALDPGPMASDRSNLRRVHPRDLAKALLQP
jgi:hypothetical protein